MTSAHPLGRAGHARARALLAFLVVGLSLWLLTAGPVRAHGSGAALEVEPTTVTAGDTVTLAGENLEPNDERILLLIGADVRLELGTVTTDEEGMFSMAVTIPSHLPGGVYEFQAIGDETLTVQLSVVGGAGTSGAPQPAATDPQPRDRSLLELTVWLVVAAASLAIGVLVVIRAERWAPHGPPGG